MTAAIVFVLGVFVGAPLGALVVSLAVIAKLPEDGPQSRMGGR
jgi:hypothetical protein